MVKSLKEMLVALVPASVLISMPSIAMAAGGALDPKDAVGISFWVISRNSF